MSTPKTRGQFFTVPHQQVTHEPKIVRVLHLHVSSEDLTCSCSCSGLVPLHNACSYGHYEVAELLVRHGASVNVADLWKFTPLHEAAAKGKYEICKLLLKVRIRVM